MRDYDPVHRREASRQKIHYEDQKNCAASPTPTFYDKQNKDIVRDTDGFIELGERV